MQRGGAVRVSCPLKYPGRVISDVLYLRDCVNLCWYDKRDRGEIRADHRRAIEAAVARFEEVHFRTRDRYYELGRKYYDQALSLLDHGVELTLQFGAHEGARRTHRVRRADDAAWLAAVGASNHFTMGTAG